MVKDTEFFKKMETENVKRLRAFNEIKNYFKRIDSTPSGYTFDASGDTIDGRGYNVELKTRVAVLTDEGTISGVNFNDDTVMIEPEKSAHLYYRYIINGDIPLYINFLEDGTVLVWNLSKLKKQPVEKCDTRINNKGYKSLYKQYRDFLYVSDAIIYPKLLNTNDEG